MPARHTAAEERATDEAKLKSQRIKLQREIADTLREQQRIYDEVMKPNSADAKLLSAQVRGGHGDKPLSPEFAKSLEGIATPTARFEWARTQIASISAQVAKKRTALAKCERELEGVRASMRRSAVGKPDLFQKVERFNQILGTLR